MTLENVTQAENGLKKAEFTNEFEDLEKLAESRGFASNPVCMAIENCVGF
jgi:hypothetical protein